MRMMPAPEGYRTVQLNDALYRVLKDDAVVGYVRRDLDGSWYAVLHPGQRQRAKALHMVIVAVDAIEEFTHAVNG
jgi:hypothetical protein